MKKKQTAAPEKKRKTVKPEEPMSQDTAESPSAAAPAMKKILEMVRAGQLTDEQAAALIAELGEAAGPKSGAAPAADESRHEPIDVKALLSNSMRRLFAGDALSNRLRASSIESPEGSDYVFKDNEIVMSNFREFTLRHASFERNHITASNLKELLVEDGSFSDSSFRMSNLREAGISGSSLRKWELTASNIRELTVKNQSRLDGIGLRASSISDLRVEEGVVEGLEMRESSFKDLAILRSSWLRSLVQYAALSDLRLSGATLQDAQFLACQLRDILIEDAELRSVLFHSIAAKDLALRGCHFNDVHFTAGDGWRQHKYDTVQFEACDFKRVLFSNCRFEKVVFANITVENAQLCDLTLKNRRIDGNEAFLGLALTHQEAKTETPAEPKKA